MTAAEGGKRLTIDKYPIPKNIWNIKTIAVAPKAADWVPVESSMAVIVKQRDWPVAGTIRRGRRPKRSTV